MNYKTKIAFGSMLVGVVALATSISTFAWFKGVSVLTVSDIKVALANKELQISTDNVNFKNSLTEDDLKPNIDYFHPVSTMFQNEWYTSMNTPGDEPVFRSFYNGPADECVMNDVKYFPIADDTGYLSRDLYLRADLDGYVSFDTSAPFFKANETRNREEAKALYDANVFKGKSLDELEEELNKITNSLRVSVLLLDEISEETNEVIENEAGNKYWIINPTDTDEDSFEVVRYGGLLDRDLDGYYDHYDGNEVLFGEVYNTETDLVYENVPFEGDTSMPSYSVFDAKTDENVAHLNILDSLKKTYDSGKPTKDQFRIAIEDATSFAKVDKQVLIPIRTGYSRHIKLSIYIEGWDKDSTNYTMYSHFLTNLRFSLTGGGMDN